MRTVTLDEAKSRLPELIAEAIAGEEVVIRNGSATGVKLVPVTPLKPVRPVPDPLRGSIVRDDDPLAPVAVEDWQGLKRNDNPYPLRGTPIRYDRPCDPVAEEDWEALR